MRCAIIVSWCDAGTKLGTMVESGEILSDRVCWFWDQVLAGCIPVASCFSSNRESAGLVFNEYWTSRHCGPKVWATGGEMRRREDTYLATCLRVLLPNFGSTSIGSGSLVGLVYLGWAIIDLDHQVKRPNHDEVSQLPWRPWMRRHSGFLTMKTLTRWWGWPITWRRKLKRYLK